MGTASTGVKMSSPDIGEAEIEAVTAVLRSGILSLGPSVDRFEAAFAGYVGTAHAVAVSSGTAGLHLCVRAAGVGPGDEVVTSPFSFVASANCILYEGARVVFADIDEESLTIDPAAVAAAVTERTRAVLPVHVFGQPCAIEEIDRICEHGGFALIEDACEAIGAEYRNRRVGTFGNSAVFSFYPNKQMTTGEGAIVTTDSDSTATTLRSLRNQGRDAGGAWLCHEQLGYNYRLGEMAAALGLVQIGRIEAMLAQREGVAGLYRERLHAIAGARLIEPAPDTTRLSWFAAIVRLDPGINRDGVIDRLAERGIPSRAYFSPLHLQPLYRALYGHREGDFPVTERVARSTIALPFHNRLTEEEVDTVCRTLAAVL